MNGWHRALRPLILGGAMVLTAGASFAQQSAGTAPARKVTSEHVTATLGAPRPGTSTAAAPTVEVDPSLGTVLTFHGSAHSSPPPEDGTGGVAAATGLNTPASSSALSPSSASFSRSAGTSPNAPAASGRAAGVSATLGQPTGNAASPATPASGTEGPVWTFHGNRSGRDPVAGPDDAPGSIVTAAPTASGTPTASPRPGAPTVDLAALRPGLTGPSTAPSGLPPLPPLPGGDTGQAALAGLPGGSLPFGAGAAPSANPVGPGVFGAPAAPVVMTGTSGDPVEDHWAALMQAEANHLTQESNVPMTVVVVRTRDDAIRRFIAQSILHEDTTRYSEADSGLSALFSMGSRVNNSPNPTCYILFRKDKIAALRDQFLAPMSAKVGEEATVAFLIGHETGHCLDYYERQRTFPTKGFWTSDETGRMGIAPPAAHRIFPNGMTPQAYAYAAPALYGDLAQRQYEERIADVFGVMWAVHRGFPVRLFDDVIDSRKWIPPSADHATLPALVGLRGRYNALPGTDVAHLWALARQVQQDAGVNREVGDGASAQAAHFDGADKFYGPVASSRTPVDPTTGDRATVVGHNTVVTRAFGQAYPAPVRPNEPAPTVVGIPQKMAPKVFGGNSFGQLKAFGSSNPSGM